MQLNELLNKYLNYVCDKCLQSLDKCNCKYNSELLIHIDRNIQDQIRQLNLKGYRTLYCCESHYGEVSDLYITFVDNCFDENTVIPDGFKYSQRQRTLRHTFSKKLTQQQFETEKQKHLDILINWIESLPNYQRTKLRG